MDFKFTDCFTIEQRDLKKMAYYYYVKDLTFWDAIYHTYPEFDDYEPDNDIVIFHYQIGMARDQIENVALPEIFEKYGEEKLKNMYYNGFTNKR